ncbi:MAG: hypothetical protein RL326_704 [Pseudomonadota bacterium]
MPLGVGDALLACEEVEGTLLELPWLDPIVTVTPGSEGFVAAAFLFCRASANACWSRFEGFLSGSSATATGAVGAFLVEARRFVIFGRGGSIKTGGITRVSVA